MEREIVDALIQCAKTIKTAPRKTMTTDPKSEYTLRNDFTCVSEDGQQFDVFMRMNTKFPYLFSIGLVYKAKEGTLILCRYNGKHPHKNRVADNSQFDNYHIHKLYDQQLSDGTEESIDAEETSEYVTFNEALYCFLRDCNIMGWMRFFPNLEDEINQMKIEGV